MLRIRSRFDHWLPKLLGVNAIVLYPFVLFGAQRENVARETIQHEFIHVRQVRARGWCRFYASYLAQYLLWRLKGKRHDRAYRNISFEIEAYGDQARIELSNAEEDEFDRGC
jgi:hypothetical protein